MDIEDIRGLYKEFLNYRDNILNRDLDIKRINYKIVIVYLIGYIESLRINLEEMKEI